MQNVNTDEFGKKTIVFFDGQNLYRCAKQAFGISHPDFDPLLLAQRVCKHLGIESTKINFYTGVPDKNRSQRDLEWGYFWDQKTLVMRRLGVNVFTRQLRYRTESILCDQGHSFEKEYAVEKGIDVRIAIDMVAAAVSGQFGNIVIFSQDQDLSEACKEIQSIAELRGISIQVYCAFPENTDTGYSRGINGAKWVRISHAEYLECVDKRRYPKPASRVRK